MRKVFSSFFLVVAVFAVMTEIAEAQYRVAPGRGYDVYAARRAYPYPSRSGYGYYDPYLERTMQEECYQARESYQGMRGTFHVHEGQMHFRPCDPTNNPVRAREGAVWGGLAGAGIGAAVGGKRGAAIGAVAGAVTGGVVGSKNGHDDCLFVDPASQQTGQGGLGVVSGARVATPSSAQVVQFSEGQGPAYRPGSWSSTNGTPYRIRVYDGDQRGENLVATMNPGEEWKLDLPRDRYRAFAYVPNYEGSVSVREIPNNPGNLGWVFAEPETRPAAQ